MEIQRQELDIEVYRDDSIYKELQILDIDDEEVDITGYTFLSQIRRDYDSEYIIAEMHVEIVDAATGSITIYHQGIDTNEVDFEDGVWDLECISDDATPIVTTAFAGSVTITEDVSRA